MKPTKDTLFLEQERTDLNLHIDLCAKRYNELNSRLENIEEAVSTIAKKIDSNRSDLYKALIATAGTIIVAVVSLIGLIIGKL